MSMEVEVLHELHYQMITLGKVSNPLGEHKPCMSLAAGRWPLAFTSSLGAEMA